MNRAFITGFLAALTLIGGVLLGALVTDAATDDASAPALPATVGAPMAIVPTRAAPAIANEDEDPDDTATATPAEPHQATVVEVAAVPLGGATPGGPVPSSSAPGDAAPTDTAPTDTTVGDTTPDDPPDGTPTPASTGDSPPLTFATDIAADIADPRLSAFFTGDLLPDLADFLPFFFVDLCADGGDGCPAGVGGTVLAPFGGGLDTLGTFRLGDHLSVAAPVETSCFGSASAELAPGEFPVFLWASHPAAFDLVYYPASDPAARSVLAWGNTNPDHPEFIRFADDAVEGRLATSPWPKTCFVLTERPVSGTRYIIEVEATSFTGETDTRTYHYDLPVGGRPPVALEPLNDHDVRVSVPIRRDTQYASVSAIHPDSGETCTGLEARAEGPTGVVFGGLSGGVIVRGIEDIPWGLIPVLPGMFDTTYDAFLIADVVGLEEGTVYQLCIWWSEDRDRSFDSANVVEREVRWVTPPNRLTALVRPRSVSNPTDGTIAAGSYVLSAACGPRLGISLPPVDLGPGESIGIPLPDRPALCDYDGRRIISSLPVRIEAPWGAGSFAIPLDPTGTPRIEQAEANLSGNDTEGPRAAFDVIYHQGSDAGGDEWSFGPPEVISWSPDLELPPEVQVDHVATRVEPAGRNAIRVTAGFDRPVRVAARLAGTDLCLTGPEPSHPVGRFSDTHTFILDGLCLHTDYSVILTVQDEEGSETVFADLYTPPYPAGARHAELSGRSGGVRVAYTVWTTGRSSGFSRPEFVMRYSVTVGEDAFDLRTVASCFTENLPGGLGGTFVSQPDAVWDDAPTEIEIELVLYDATRTADSRCATTYVGMLRSSVSTTITLEDTDVGTEFDARIPFVAEPIRDSRAPLDVEILITGRVTG